MLKSVVKEIILDSPLLYCDFYFNTKFREFFSKQTGVVPFKFTADITHAVFMDSLAKATVPCTISVMTYFMKPIIVLGEGCSAGRRKSLEKDTESRQCRANKGKEEKDSQVKESLKTVKMKLTAYLRKCMRTEPVRR